MSAPSTDATPDGTARPRAAAGGRTPPLHRPLASYYLLLGSAGLLLVIGLVMVLSASSVNAYEGSGSSLSIFLRQLMWVGLGAPAMWIGMHLPVRAFRALAYPALLFALVTLVAVLIPGVGTNIYGATRWISIGGLTYQPSELAKLALALWGADLLVRKRRRLHEWKHLLVPLLPVTGLVAVLIMLEPDLGTTLVVMLVVMSLLFVVGAPMRVFGLFAGAVVALATLMIAVEPYRMRRITGFLDPFADAQDTGYQAVQGLYALSSGGWFGVGLGASRQKWDYLPNANTDYIFAIIGEELGLMGTLLVLALFTTLAFAGIRVARRAPDPFARLASAAVITWLIGQTLINIGAVVALLPITGIPLPLISAGGSALIPTMFSIGMLAAFARTEPGAKEALALRRRPVRTAAARALASSPLGRRRSRAAAGAKA